MAQVVVQMGAVPTHTIGGNAPVMVASTVRSEEVTSGASQSTTTLEARHGDCVTIKNNGAEDVWVAIGASPTAAVGTNIFVPADSVDSFSGLSAGDKVSVINDS